MAKKAFPSDKLDQYIVRFPDGMRDRLKDEAAKNNRSLNAEIVARLDASFEKGESIPREQVADIVQEAIEVIARYAQRHSDMGPSFLDGLFRNSPKPKSKKP